MQLLRKDESHTYIHSLCLPLFASSPPPLVMRWGWKQIITHSRAEQRHPQSQLPAGQASLISRHHSDITGESTAVQIENTEFTESNQNLCQDLQSLKKNLKAKQIF